MYSLNTQVIDVTRLPHTAKAIFGTTVVIVNLYRDEQQRVGDETDIKQAKIAVSSAITHALVGKEEGDIASVETPRHLVEYEIDKGFHL